ncbi:DNA polymerase III subunit gamma/tau [Ferribacterium limneticum]|uniref:DNA polymerase III subunit gamma/tau n=1 Tax=Ferribacterium limneticum TaxID=76259 RepID=UPI001CFB1195|nr:DNA polymerase III subunit gamma/tau [Ferribacterium limneticum]UCV27627.1 DNA polymerase III subunit gamma/tau [Ferribacterium limneticum]UCV31544.1 DNA polymerase III subunit gamma/tau [Ferribacterium limneticum]
MSYQVLARKWRPRNFSTLVGQEHVVRALTHALSEQRLHHAYLFTGTRGVGKTTLARILAKSLNCETGITATPCGTCSACQEIDSGRFVDLLEVDAATNTRVDEMRQLLENAVYAPTRGRFKVYVIDEVHMLSNSAFNAMLKTLEEPPEHVKFILATTDPQKIPVTVLSRCLQFNLKQMPAVAITGHLAQILQAEGIPFDQPALALVARSATGSMRDALSLLDQAIAHGAGKVEEAQVRSMLGTVDQDYLFAILEALRGADPAALLQVAADLGVRSLSFSAALQELGALLTRLQIVQWVPGTIDEDEPEKVRLTALAGAFSPEYVQLAYQIVNVGRAELAAAPDEYAGFVMTLLRLFAFRPSSVADVVGAALPRARVAGTMPKAISAAPVLPARAEPISVPAVVPKSAPVASGEMDWHQIVSSLALSGLARELAQNCELRQLSQNQCLLRLSPAQGHLQMKPNPDKLQQALREFFGRSLQVRIELAQNETVTPAETVGRQRQEQQERAVNAIAQDTFVRDVIECFDASIVESSIKPIG